MELRHLRYFIAVAEAGGFVKAASTLNLAQPALSRQVKDLERELGVALFERLAHGTRLTRAGQRFLPDARRIVGATQKAAARLRRDTPSAGGDLMVGYGELLAHWRAVSDVFHSFRVAHPRMPLNAMQFTWSEMQSALRLDQIDVGIIGTPSWPPRGFDGERLLNASQTGVLLPAGHPLAARATVRIAELESMTWFHLGGDAAWGVFPHLKAALRERGFKSAHRSTRPGSYAYLPQIAAGDGWSLADKTLGKIVQGLTRGIVYRPFEDPPITVWVAALWKRGQRAQRVLDFIEVARNQCKVDLGAEPAGSGP